MTTKEVPMSPRLEALKQELETADRAALDRLWEEVTHERTPLIESIDGDDNYALVTFLWRATDEVTAIGVVSIFAAPGAESDAMIRIPGTDLWHKTYRVRNDIRATYQFALAGAHVTDPLNPRTHVFSNDDENNFTGWASSVFELPGALPQPWMTPQPGAPTGQVQLHRLHSSILDREDRVWVYTPPDYRPNGAPYGLLLMFDGWFYAHVIPMPTILDYLIAEKQLPPVVAVMVGSLFDEARDRDLSCYPPYLDFLTSELMPWAHQHYHLTRDPAQSVVGGLSLGGTAAAYTGLRCPELFGNVLSQSGWFGWKPEDDSEYEWLPRQFAATPQLLLRFYLDAGLFETDTPSGDQPSLLLSNRHMRTVLHAKGYPVHYTEFNGAHDPISWQATLPYGLLALIGKDLTT